MIRIVVCAKYVPDSTADRRFRSNDNTVDRAGVDGLLSELDENAVEGALAIAASGDAEVTVLTVGPEQALGAVKKALQMGADAGVHVLDGSTVRIRRDGDASSDTVEDTLPLVLSVTDAANEPRYPSFKGIMAAKKKQVRTWSLSDLGVSPDEVGSAAACSRVLEVTARPPRTAGTVVTDADGSGAARLAEFLSTNKFLSEAS